MSDEEKQKRVIQFLLKNWARLQREELVFQKFLRELKEEGRVGILEDLDRIRHSPEIEAAYAKTFQSLDAIVSSALGEMSLDQVEKMLQHLPLDTGEPN